jgi:uncharacterized protein YjaZ
MKKQITIYDFIKSPGFWRKRTLFDSAAKNLDFLDVKELKEKFVSIAGGKPCKGSDGQCDFDYESVVFAGLNILSQHFSEFELTFFIMPSFVRQDSPRAGHSGIAGKKTICLSIAKKGSRRKDLLNLVLHEGLHAIHQTKYPYKGTLLENIISEGLAEVFVAETIKTKPLGGRKIASEVVLRRCYASCRPYLHETDVEHVERWMYGHWADAPAALGYQMGYLAVRNFRRHYPKLKWMDLVEINPEEIISKI